jgi:transmembrane sensor
MAWGALGVIDKATPSTGNLVAEALAEPGPGNVIPLRAAGKPDTPGARRGHGMNAWVTRVPKIAAAMIVGIVLWVGASHLLNGNTVVTARGEQRSVTLADGSVITLNTDAALRVHLKAKERDIELLRGEARFQVAKDPARPFIVRAQSVQVQALGTVFNVRTGQGPAQVAVLEGHVAVDALGDVVARGASPTTRNAGGAIRHVVLKAGERAIVDQGSLETGEGPPLEAVKAWTERRLVFQDQSLQDVLAEFNRYRTHPLVLDDPALGALVISGVFEIGDPDSLLTYLRRFETVSMRSASDGSEHLYRESEIRPD